MKGIQLTGKILTKILEVFHWVAVGLMSLAAVFSFAAPQWLKFVVDVNALLEDPEVSVYGFEVTAVNAADQIDYTTLCLFAIGAVIVFVLMALIFRNLHLIIKTAETASPFHNSNIRRLKQIGILSICIPLAGLLMSILIRLVAGVDAVEISLDQSGIVMGIIVLCLTQYFIHGAKLEQDVDGLV